ncbi:MAG: hypothetical protein IKS51_08270 [Erysipelotrichaceae bacterium]|nr:hypothetical protein [Erysipelotrichaceae bacterium]
MKAKKIVLAALLALCLILAGCQTSPKEVDSEEAMNNFLKKLDEGNYTLEVKDYLKATASSKDQVTFEYVEDIYNDFVAMSVNDEVFQGFLNGDQLEDVKFLGEGTALEAAGSKLPNGWLDLADGNIWNLFYNIQEDPLKFVSYDDVLKQSVISLVGYSDNALRLMHEVYLVLDKENPTTARIQAEMDEDLVARVSYDDVDVEIKFGKTSSNPLADAWMKDPVYPEARSAWNDTDEFIFNSVFLPEYGLEAIPFPDFASYALMVDGENFVWDDEVSIRDSHASEQDMADYVSKLLQNGFSEVKETAEDGAVKTCYRKMLREAFDCYSSIELEYDNGVNLTAKKYYDCPEYDMLDEINEAIAKIGYPALPDSENFTSYHGIDRANEMTESWLYFFHYDLGLYADIGFNDKAETEAYLKAYEETLLDNGFTPNKGGEDEEEEAEYYQSENGFYSFRYSFTDDNVLNLLFKSEKYISAEEAKTMIVEAGFPKIDLHDPITCRDLVLFRKIRYGTDMKAYITVSQTFESAEEAEAFLDAYETALNEAGFDRVNPENVGSLKAIAIANEDLSMYVGIDYFPDDALVNFEFSAD